VQESLLTIVPEKLRHQCYWCQLALIGIPQKEGTGKRLVPANESKQREGRQTACAGSAAKAIVKGSHELQ